MDAIKAIADGIRAERKAELEKSTESTAADVVQAVAPQQAEKAPEPETKPAEESKSGSETVEDTAAPDDKKKE